MARICSNENVAKGVVDGLRALGHDVLTSHQAGNANAAVPDEDVLAFALDHERALITNNRRDFRRLHSAGAAHAGIVDFTVDVDFRSLASRIDAALADPAAQGRFYMSVTLGGHTSR